MKRLAKRQSGVTAQLAVIYHPQKIDLKRVRAAVERTLLESQISWAPTLWFPTTESETGAAQAKQALDAGVSHLMVAGGDGTLRPVFEELVSTDLAVGLLPMGTGNILARNLGLPLLPVQQLVRRAILGEVKQLDGAIAELTRVDGSVDSHFFTVISGIGLDATIIQNADPKLKSRIGWLAYFDAGMKALPLKYERLAISVDGKPIVHKKVITLLVGNVGFMPMKISLMPEALLDDGRLDVAVIAPRRFWHWTHLWSRITWERWILGQSSTGRWVLDNTKDIKTLQNLSGETIEVIPDVPANIQLDGDGFGAVTKVVFKVLPRSVKIRL